MTFKERVFAAAQNNNTLVFPTQSSADSWAVEYARSNPGKPAFADAFISWDSFRDSCRSTPSDLKEAGYVHRLIFTSEFLKYNALNALCPPSYPEAKALFADEIASALPEFRSVVENQGNAGNTAVDMLADIRKILAAYKTFLSENGLYEKSFLEPDFRCPAAEGNTVLVFPRACNDSEIERALAAGIKTIEPEGTGDAGSEAVITVYRNTLDEIRSTLDRVRQLLEEGTPARDIKITICGTEMLPWLGTEAYRRNIVLDVKIGKTLAEYPAGAMFRAIENVGNSQWSPESLKSLLLNPSFPFRNREKCLELIRLGIDLKVVPGRKARSWMSKLGRADEKTRGDILEFLITLRDRTEAITGAGDVNSLREAIHAFEDDFLGEKDVMQAKVYSRCMEELENLADASASGLPEKPFSLFVRILSRQRYMPKTDDTGVAVYLYPSNAGMVAPYHFAVGFDDEKTGRERSVSLFSDAEGVQIGDELIRSYESGGVVFSCSTDSYTGHATVPAYFAVKNSINSLSDKPEYSGAGSVFSFEEDLWAENRGNTGSMRATELQRKWFESLQPDYRPANNENYDALKPNISISATELNNFIKCPYRWYCGSHYGLGLKRLNYEADMGDSMEVGSMIHFCLEEWLLEERDFSKLGEESSRRKLEDIFEKHFRQYSLGAGAPYEPQLRHLALTLPQAMFSLSEGKEAGNLADYSVLQTEKQFDENGVKGRIDCVLEDVNGNLAILDFKKGAVDKSSVQLQFYSYGLDRLPVRGAYFSVNGRKYTVVWDDTGKLKELVEDMDSELENMRRTIDTGRFESTPSDSSCMNCDFRSICRKRFVIK